jgi:hypothetical protein
MSNNVTPGKAGVQTIFTPVAGPVWMPAFAGMTGEKR